MFEPRRNADTAAFGHAYVNADGETFRYPGLTKREVFALQSATMLFPRDADRGGVPVQVTMIRAIAYADGLLEELHKTHPSTL